MLKTKGNKGITLVALVVTVIVLIVLAAVTINLVVGQNGIITRAQQGAENYKVAEQDEQDMLAGIDSYIEQQMSGKIPSGFSYKEGTIDTGFVIEGPDGSEFVWIPVEDINSMVMCQSKTADTQCNIEMQSDGTLKCITHNSNTLAGKLYATIGGNTFTNDLTTQSYTVNSGLREADIVTDYDTDSNLTTYGIGLTQVAFKKQLQDEFIAMAESVAKNKGFYVGRYETGLNGIIAQSKAGKNPMTAEESSGNRWWGMYVKQKNYTSSNNLSNVTSGMMWGCQWDQMMLFLEKAGYNIKDSTAWGNHSDSTGNAYIEGISGSRQTTGKSEYWKACNLYDVAGNAWELTLEAVNTNFRTCRGGRSGTSGSAFSASYRGDNNPSDNNDIYGSRMQLYL